MQAIFITLLATSVTVSPRITAIGIDLGTTNSAVCVYDRALRDGVMVPNRHGELLTPSIVSYSPDGAVLVGRDAIGAAAANPLSTFRSVKRLIGRDLVGADELALAAQLLPSKQTLRRGGELGRPTLFCPALGRELQIEEVSAAVIGALLEDVRAHLSAAPGGAPTADELRCVLTVPAQFDDAQRAATEAAARLAGLVHVRLMREPVAAALAFGVMGRALDAADGGQAAPPPPAAAAAARAAPAASAPAQTVLVVDVGAGTTDVSVLRVQDGLVEVLATAADGRLGGDDMDDALEAWLLDALAAAAHAGAAAAIRAQPALRFGARRALEAAKVALSVRKAASVTLPCASDGSAPSASQPPLELTLSRAELEAACGPVLARLKRPIYEAALNAQLTLQGERERADTAPRPSRGGGVGGSGSRKQKGGARAVGPAPGDLVAASDGQLERSRALPGGKALDALVMVGGVTHMLGMRTLAANLAGVEVRRTVDPMQAVARGAALQAAVTEGLATGLAVEDTWQAQLRAAYRQLERELAEKALRAGGAEGGLAEAAESASDDAWAAFPAADAFDDDDDDDADGEVIWIDEEGNEVAPP